MEKSLDRKIARILADPSCSDFILADAKDADMAFGLAAPGKSPEHHGHEARFRSLAEYRQLIRDNVRQGLVDIMLMSVSTSELLTINERLFDDSPITPAIRANDTTDIWLATGGTYAAQPSRPFRTATIDHAMCGKVSCEPGERKLGADLGLYSITFNNDVERDREALEAYKQFRVEAEGKGFRHFLEVFDPNACGDRCPPDIGRFIADHVARTLAGVTRGARPIFLKIPYHGPAMMEALAAYDRTLIPGILGGGSGTTFDAFYQLWEARKYGARAALYGRMINASEHQPTFIQHLRWIADGQLEPTEAVRYYHASLERLRIRPYRKLEDDLQLTARGVNYGSTAKTQVVVNGLKPGPAATDGEPDFARMSQAEKIAWNLSRWDRVLNGAAKRG